METPMPNPSKHFQWKLCIPYIFKWIMHLTHNIVRPFYSLLNARRLPNVPPIKNPLLKISASTLAKMIRNGEISSQTVVEAYIERILEVDPFLNAVVEHRFNEALNDAKVCDEKLGSGEVTAAMLEQEKPLYGVPFTVKESCGLKGLSHTIGAVARKGVKSPEDGVAVELFKNAGAIALCVTNVPEMCGSFHTENFLFGTTKNPYDRRRTGGGSSGGEGALISTGASILGIGSDLLGSIRLPCYFNGIFGHKPTPGIISIQGHFPICDDPLFHKLLVVGPMARYMEDLHLAMKVLTSKSEKCLGLDDPVDLTKLRVFFIDNFESFCGVRKTRSDIRLTIKQAARHLAQKGARVRQLSQDWFSNMFNILIGLFGELKLCPLLLNSKDPEKKKNATFEFFKSIFGLSEHIPSLALLQASFDTHAMSPVSALKNISNIREDLIQKLNDLLKDDGVIICPTYPLTAPFPQSVFFLYDYSAYSALPNILHLPSTQVPMGLNYRGLPIGFQVVAASCQDRLCLAVAKELEKEFGGWVPPPS